jgi:hypothetical protein
VLTNNPTSGSVSVGRHSGLGHEAPRAESFGELLDLSEPSRGRIGSVAQHDGRLSSVAGLHEHAGQGPELLVALFRGGLVQDLDHEPLP